MNSAAKAPPAIRVLVVDDSATGRGVLVSIFQADPRFAVVGQAANGEEALRLVESLAPDVITMDLHMPGMGGLAAVSAIMARFPRPIVVVSDQVLDKNSRLSMAALEAGALEAVGRPDITNASAVKAIQTTVWLMAGVRVIRRNPAPRQAEAANSVRSSLFGPARRLVAIGASTGGPFALREILRRLEPSFPLPIVLVQHMAPGFTITFAQWLASEIRLPVTLIEQNMLLAGPGVFVGPEGFHVEIGSNGNAMLDPLMRGYSHQPAIDVLFSSLADHYGEGAVGVLLTGMGEDGAGGLLRIRAARGLTIVQDEASSVVYGMPKVAFDRGAAMLQLDLGQIALGLTDAAGAPPACS